MQPIKLFTTFILILVTSLFCFSQDVILSSQADVDIFDPSTTTINGNLTIGGTSTSNSSDIIDLSNLSNITSVIGDLIIAYNSDTIKIDSLHNISSISGNLSIRVNADLTNLDGLSSLNSVSNINIELNNALTNINGLSNLNSVSNINISDHYNLTNLDGLSGLNTINDLTLLGNNALTSIDGLSNVNSINNLDITLNTDLTNLDGLTGLTAVNNLRIASNYDLISTDGLANLASVNHLTIEFNDQLDNINGFSGLTAINNLLIYDNFSLANIDGFANVNTINNIDINFNPALSNLDGFASLTTCNNFYLNSNYALNNIDGLSNLTTVNGYLDIQDNNVLQNINGLSSLNSVGSFLQITFNTQLEYCCGIQNLLLNPDAVDGSVSVHTNLPSCNSPTEILESDCGNNVNIIEGNVFLDSDANCTFNTNDILYENIIVQADSPELLYTTVTDSLGYYKIFADTGYYEVKAYMSNPYTEACTPSYFANIIDDTASDSFNFDFAAIVNTDCPYLEVDLSTWSLQSCSDNYYFVQYCNSGTVDATEAYVELELDSVLSINSASIPFTGPDSNNIYTFDIGTVSVGDCANFNLNILLPCDSLNLNQFEGQTFCVDAHIYPDSICLPPSNIWDGSSVQVTGECVQDSIIFRVKNIGLGDMLSGKTLQVFEDQVMFIQNPFQLNSGEEIELAYFANGSTFRLDAEQADGHPGNSNPSVVVEACGTGPIYSLGFVNQFSQDDGDIFVSSECREVLESVEANFRLAFPTGYGEEHFIERNTEIEYLIGFQNTGTETAFSVVIENEINPLFDITTIQPGASSHPYSFEIDSVIRFVFDDITLESNSNNEIASRGFVKFRIAQQENLPNGTVLENNAEIYFDTDPAIITNTTFHTIGENFVTINLISTATEIFQIASIKAFPNPFSEIIQFELEGNISENIILSVFDVNGKQVATRNYNSSIFQFERGNLTDGVYFYTLSSEGIDIANGKMILN